MRIPANIENGIAELPPAVHAAILNGTTSGGWTCGNAVVSATPHRCLCLAPLHAASAVEGARRLLAAQLHSLDQFGALQVAVNGRGQLCLLHKFDAHESLADHVVLRAWQAALSLAAALG